MKLLLIFLSVWLQFNFIFMDIEYLNSIHHGLNLDPELLKNAENVREKKENKLCKANPESVWSYVEKEIDYNHDDKIDMTEFRNKISKQIKKNQRKELEQLIKILDPNDTGSITFTTYIKDALTDAYDIDEILKVDKTSNPDLNELRNFYETEKKKWYFISKGNDNLSHDQFGPFIFSDDYQDIKDFENELFFNIHDTNKDGFWSFEEYMQIMKHYQDDVVNKKQKYFLPKVDLNNDNHIDLNEFKIWQNKLGAERLLTEENEHVFIPCDSDKDSMLNRTETILCCEKIMSSYLTDFGEELGVPKYIKDEL